MKKKEKGFTLIELLGVLILLAVIALITFPIIDKVLSNAKNEAYERQKDSIIEAARMYVTTNGNYSTSTKQLSFQTLIDSGYLKDGEILDPRDSSKEMPGCVLYNWSASKNQYMFEYSEECSLPSYAAGDLLKVQVSDSETQNIYVLEANGNEIVGILDRNLPGGTEEWISTSDYNSAGGNWSSDSDEVKNQNLYEFGPITANKALNERTSSWNKVTKKYLPEAPEILKLTEYYKELESSGETANWESKYFTDFNGFIQANEDVMNCSSESECRQAITAAGGAKYLLPEWAIINLETTGDSSAGYGYWTSTPTNYSVVSVPGFAWHVRGDGLLHLGNVGDIYSADVGVRPVIHIYESNILSKLEAAEYVNLNDVVGAS